MPNVVVYYVDDEASKAARRYQERLSRAEGFECKLIPPPELGELGSLVEDCPDLFLIDYELSLVQPDGTKAAYKGSTLAAEIRARHPDCPIVLITRQSILDQLDRTKKRQLTERMQVCDELILKDDLDNKLDETRQLLISIADGFRTLGGIADKTWGPLVEVLGASREEAELLREAAPPLQEGQWIVTGAAGWIRSVVLEFPGILYDPVNAATRLGISVEAFFDDKVQELMDPAKYAGVFAPNEGRWWKGRLFRIAKELAMEEGVGGPINQAFTEAFCKRFGIELSPAVCVWDHRPVADWVCYILRQPVKIKYSLRYYPDSRPSIMHDTRVSFRAIRESNKFYEELLDSAGLNLLKEIEELPEP
ncbi:MAG: hypothetical protein ACE5H0_09490 [Bacteroidota bacterium]